MTDDERTYPKYFDKYAAVEELREIIVLQRKGRYRIATVKLEQLEQDLSEAFQEEI